MGSSLAWLIGDVSHRVAGSAPLLNLLGIKYVVFQGGDKPDDKTVKYQKLHNGNFFDIYKIPENYPFFFAHQKKPVLVYCSKKSWYYLNKIWLKFFLKKGEKIAHFIKTPENFYSLVKTNCFSSIILLNFPDTKINKNLYFDVLRKFIENKGVIYSNKPLWGLPVKKFIPSDEKSMENILISSDENSSQAELKSIESTRYDHTFEYNCHEPRFVAAKTIYYGNWKAFDKQGYAAETFYVSPGHLGIFIDKPNGIIKLKYMSSKLHIGLFLLAVCFCAVIFIFRKKITSFLKTVNYPEPVSRKKTIFSYAGVIGLVFAAYFFTGYFQQAYLLKIPLIYPLNNQKNLSPIEITFHWNRLFKNEKYNFQLAEDKNFTKLSASTNERNSTFIICNGLKEKTKYYWRVKITPDNKTPRWSKTHVFHTGSY